MNVYVWPMHHGTHNKLGTVVLEELKCVVPIDDVL